MSPTIPEVFLDTDVILDLALDREPFGVLRKASGHDKALGFLNELTAKVSVLGTDSGAWRLAVAADWGDLGASNKFCVNGLA